MADRSVVVRLVANTAGFAAPLQAAAVQAKAFGSEINAASVKNSEGFKKLSEGAAVAGGGILAAFGGAIAITAEFDKQMSSVGAAANATSGQLGQLREAAINAGAATSFGATDAARAEEELAKAGVSVKDILNGGLTGALNLAAAGQLDLGEAAETAATAMTQFGLSGDQVPHIADLLSAAANKAQGSVHDIGYALKAGGLVAAQFGISIEQTTGTLAAFASAGLIGSDAGTSLKTMLLALANPSAKAATTMQQLGLSAYDAQGKFVGLQNFAGQLKDKLAGLTQEQRNQALATIFGSDAIRAANVLYNQGSQGIADWTNKVNDSGNAARTAQAKLNNLSGDIEVLKGSLETGLIQTGSQATGTLRVLTQAATGAVNGFVALPGPAKEVVTVIGLVAGAALLAGGLFGTLAPKIKEARLALTELGPAGEKANAALGTTLGVVGKVTAVLAAFQIASAAVGDQNAASGVSTDSLAKSMVTLGETGKVTGGAVDVLHGHMQKLGSDLQSLDNSGLGHVGNAIGTTIENLTGMGTVMDDSILHSKERIGELDTALAQLVTSGHADQAAAAYKKISDEADKQGIKTKELAAGFSQYNAALDKAKQAADLTGQSEEKAAQKTQLLTSGFQDAASAADGLTTAWNTLNGAVANSDSAMLKANKAVDDLKKSFQENGRAVTGNTTAALTNRVAMEAVGKAGADAAQAVLDGGGSLTTAQQTWQGYHDQIIKALEAMGYVPAKAKEIADSLDKMPSLTAPKVEVTGTEDAKAKVAGLDTDIKNLKDHQVKIAATGTDVMNQQLVANQNHIDALHDKQVSITQTGAQASSENVQTLTDKIRALQAKQVRVEESGARDSAARVKALQDQIRALQSKVVTLTTIERHVVTTVTSSGEVAQHGNSRWGNVYAFAAGGVTPAHIAKGDLLRYAEPATGGEAFIPRLGNPSRSLGILETAASWYGAQVVRGQAGAGSARASVVSPSSAPMSQTSVNVDVSPVVARLDRLERAIGGMSINLDGRRVGSIQGREADLYSRAG